MPEPATNATINPFPVRADRSRSKYAHDNPRWAVSSRRNAAIAATLHRACGFTTCSTLVAAIIVSCNDFAYFRDRPPATELHLM
ncbi:hypothetical protein IU450_31160 [Nocardia abscessus]|uniref:hypothetical protein n=1 Tax=Nocardia abscessus TaxID=120957 RepID=UPI001893FDFF|nr:hypothetical protein [Nocardia abscessus]MBF6340319.1 hypothetical protein [Nocardia abscessus]